MHYLQAILAYILWGVFPLYWQLLQVNAFEVTCHRVVWAMLTLVICITLVRQWSDLRAITGDRSRLVLCTLASLLISTNWLVFIWAVQNKCVVDASFGYFINPLLSVLLGVFLFEERLHPVQWCAVAMAALGVAIMAIGKGNVPWIALTLAWSFALYGAVKKKTTLPAIAGLGMETAILFPLSLAILGYLGASGQSTADSHPQTWLLLIGGGPITTIPLVLFAAAAKKVPLVVMGMLQYIAPTIQFVVGLQKEPVNEWGISGFACVWISLILLSAYMLQAAKARAARTGNPHAEDINEKDSENRSTVTESFQKG